MKVTSAYNLPCKYIFHTVGPIVYGTVSKQNREDLASCYTNCLNKAAEMHLSTIAFCCISTGVFGYPKNLACSLAVATVKQWLAEHVTNLKVIFNVFTDVDKELYQNELEH